MHINQYCRTSNLILTTTHPWYLCGHLISNELNLEQMNVDDDSEAGNDHFRWTLFRRPLKTTQPINFNRKNG